MSGELEQLIEQGFRARREHRPAEAERCLKQAVELARESGIPSELARALTGLGQIERDLGNPEVALRLYLEAAAIYRTGSDSLRLAHTVRWPRRPPMVFCW